MAATMERHQGDKLLGLFVRSPSLGPGKRLKLSFN